MHDIGFDAEKWVRRGPFAYVLGKAVPARWHLTADRARLTVRTRCKRTVPTVLGYDTRRTDPLTKDRCIRCMDDLARLIKDSQFRGKRGAYRKRKNVGKVDLGAAREAAAKEGLITTGGKNFKLKDGDNCLRIVDGPLAHDDEYNGKPNFRWLFYVIDREDKQLKTMFMSPVIFDQLTDLQKDGDYEFSEVPMPFDLNIKTTNAGTLKARYSVIPSPKRIPLTPEELAAFTTATPLAEVQRLLRAKRGESVETHEQTNGTTKFDPDEIPF